MSNPIRQFNARVHGDGRRVVVLCHGFGADQTSWDAQVKALVAGGHRVITFDLAGATAQTLACYQPQRHRLLYGFAEDVVLLLRAMEVQEAAYVGHSVGGIIGLLACNGAPGLFDTLILLGSSARYLDDPDSGYVGGFKREQVHGLLNAMQDDYAAWANGFAPLMVGRPDQPLVSLDFTRQLLALRPDIAREVLRTTLLCDHRADVERVRVPVHVLQTASDPAVPMSAAQWLATHSRARDVTVIPTQGHFPQWTAPDAVNAHLLRCLEPHAQR